MSLSRNVSKFIDSSFENPTSSSRLDVSNFKMLHSKFYSLKHGSNAMSSEHYPS